MKIGILRESKTPLDTRVPLTPKQCRFIQEEYPDIQFCIQSSPTRCFSDAEYEAEGIVISSNPETCDVFMGVKEVDIKQLVPEKTYLFFSHTVKKQRHNKKLLRAVLEKKIRLIDYEMMTGNMGARLIGFGRWAGIIGAYHGIRAYCIKNGIKSIPLPNHCRNLDELKNAASEVSLPPVRVIITGGGRVAGGVMEIMDSFGIKAIPVEHFLNQNNGTKPVYGQLDPGEYSIHKNRQAFDLQHFYRHPEEYDSNFHRFCSKTDILVMAAYWHPQAPVMFKREMMLDNNFSIQVIADITCDLDGSIPSTIKSSTFEHPYYDYNPLTGKDEPEFSKKANVTVMAIDNLPCGLPRESSTDFGAMIIEHIIPLLSLNDSPEIITRATISRNGQLTEHFSYLNDWVNEPE